MKLSTVNRVFWIVFAVGILLFMLAKSKDSDALYALTLGCFALDFVFHLVFYRCPNCGRHIWRNYGDHCAYCGEKYRDTEN